MSEHVELTATQRRTLDVLADGEWHKGSRHGAVLGGPATALVRLGLAESISVGRKDGVSEYRITDQGLRLAESGSSVASTDRKEQQ